MRLVVSCLLVLLTIGPALAVQPDEKLADPALEARARALSTELRCLVCQSETIDESNAPLARDLRLLLRERLVAGDSDEEAIDFIVARYGDYVLMNPRVQSNTLLLWFGPALLLLIGAVTIVLLLRRSAVARAPAALSDAEQAELDRLLKKDREA